MGRGMTRRRISTRAALGAALAFLGGGFGLAAGTASPAGAEPSARSTEKLELVTAGGVIVLNVEIADTPARQALGLMYRTELPDGYGMLFTHAQPRESTMWMRNTYIPLDMVFIRADGTVHRIAQMTEPHSEEVIASKGPVTAVLEIAGGAAVKLGLKAGDKVRHRHFGTAQ
jgi:uncharacterized membrane protein (UPF0127 family)